MAEKLFPSLSTDGWVSDKNVLMQKLFEMFLASDFSQGTFDDAESLKYILNKPGLSNEDRISEIATSLDRLYGLYYDSVMVDVDFEEKDGLVSYSMSISALYDGETYSLENSIKSDYYSDIDDFENRREGVLNG